MNEVITNHDDIGYTVVSWGDENHLNFRAHKIVGTDVRVWHTPGEPPTHYEREWEGKTDGYPELELKDAAVYLHGTINWDSCSNWTIDENKRAMIHFCSKSEAAAIGKLFEKMYDLAKAHFNNDQFD